MITGIISLCIASYLLNGCSDIKGNLIKQEQNNCKCVPDFSAIAERVMPSVVSISVELGGEISPAIGEKIYETVDRYKQIRKDPNRSGSGFIMKKENGTFFVVTNEHVIRDAEKITIITHKQKEYNADVIGTDKYNDIALIKFESKDEKLPFLKFGDSDIIRIGEDILAVSKHFDSGIIVTSGIVSARNFNTKRNIDIIQTNAEINSGGTLINMDGKVIGINFGENFNRNSRNLKIGSVIPSNTAGFVIEQLFEHGEVQKAIIGVLLQDVTEELFGAIGCDRKFESGALVLELILKPNKLQKGDVIIQIDNNKITNYNEIFQYTLKKKPGDEVKITFYRNCEKINETVKLRSYQDLLSKLE
jgi:serine protease Do